MTLVFVARLGGLPPVRGCLPNRQLRSHEPAAQRRVPMFRPESVCHLQMEGITIERLAQSMALLGATEIELNHVVMQLTSPATLEIGSATGKQLRRFVPGDIHVIPQESNVSLLATGASHAIVVSFDNKVLE